MQEVQQSLIIILKVVSGCGFQQTHEIIDSEARVVGILFVQFCFQLSLEIITSDILSEHVRSSLDQIMEINSWKMSQQMLFRDLKYAIPSSRILARLTEHIRRFCELQGRELMLSNFQGFRNVSIEDCATDIEMSIRPQYFSDERIVYLYFLLNDDPFDVLHELELLMI